MIPPLHERPPYTAMVIGLAMLGLYLMPEPGPVPAAEVLRDGSPPAPWVKPGVEDLLAGRACIPLERLLQNRPIEAEHSYARSVVCEGDR